MKLNNIILLTVVALALLVVVIDADCLNSCSGHGTCHHSTCTCQTGWAGEDCSIADDLLVSGQKVQGSLRTFQWHYYHIPVSSASKGLLVELEQTSRFGDIDLYVQKDDYPTTKFYYDKDITTSKSVSLEIPDVPSGTWYVGLYGYWEADYDLTVTVQSSCIIECVYGTCQVDHCVCDSPYTGEDCSIYDLALTSGNGVHDSVNTREFKYYHINVQSGQFLNVDVNQDHSAKDVDVYLRLGDRPDFFDFDYLNASLAQNSSVSINDPVAGLWYIGVYGYNGDSYTITATTGSQPSCQNKCSGAAHGTCSSGRCNCIAGYTGSGCEKKTTALTDDLEQPGYVDTNAWNYYIYNSATQNNVNIKVTQDNEDGDCDLYVREGDDPTRLSYQFADLSYDQEFTLVMQAPGFATWHIGVFGWQSCTYTLTISEDSSCSCIDANHGHCAENSDVCVCNPGYAGVDCSQTSNALSNGEVRRHQTVGQNQWKYFDITTNSHAMLVSMKESATSGFLYLLVSMSGYPTLDNYDYSDFETNTDLHEIHIVFPTANTRRYFIGVYGNAFDISPEPVDFSLTAWSPPF